MKLFIAIGAALVASAALAANPPTPVADRPAAKAPAAPNPNLVEAKNKAGKTVHYDCSKKGNLTKAACKK